MFVTGSRLVAELHLRPVYHATPSRPCVVSTTCLQVLQAVNAHMTEAVGRLPLTHTNSFELLRFDLMLDEHKRLFLIEVST